jgi:hypothetical protein
MYLVLSLIQLMIVQSVHHNHSIEWWCTLCTIIRYIRERTRYIRYYDDDVHFVHSSAVSGKEQGTFDTMMMMYTLYNHQLYQGKNKVHSILWLWCPIECTLFFPWYSWWMYKVDITIIVSNAPCSFPDIVQSSAISGKEQGTFDTMIVMYTLYSHQLYQGKNKVHSILWLWCPLCTFISCIRERTRYIR